MVNAFFPAPPGTYGAHGIDSDHFMAVNICSPSRDTWREVCRRLDKHLTAGKPGCFHETVFAEMTADGSMAAEVAMFPTERWYEVDEVNDLWAAERLFPADARAAGGPELCDSVPRAAAQ